MEEDLDKHWLWLENNLLPCLEDFDNPVEAVEFGQAKIKSLIANEQDTKDALDCECGCEGVSLWVWYGHECVRWAWEVFELGNGVYFITATGNLV